jgi:4-hydroxy-3-polyprenylbenzoate decarboxylase
VDWNCELGTITRRAFGNGDGPALLFRNIKDYRDNARCRQLFTGGLSNYSRVAMMFGLPKKAPITDLVTAARKAFSGRLPPVKVATGPVKENIVTGGDINLYDFPVPQWHRRDGGRYINTMQGTVTRDPVSGRMNVGIYRGMIGRNNTIPVLLWRPQNWGQDFAKYTGQGEEMPVAFVYGWEPCLPFCASSPIPPDVSEYDVMGAVRGAPVELVDCETVPLQVPASAEMVLEGHIAPDDVALEGPFGDHTGYYNEVERFPIFTIARITMRRDPIYHSTYTGKPPDEPAVLGMALNEVFVPLLQKQFPEIADFYLPPEGCSYRLAVVSMKKEYAGHAKRVMFGVWSFLRQFMYTKFIIVTDADVDIRDWKEVIWALTTRVDPARDTLIVENTPIDYLDFASPVAGLGAKMGIDATNKWPGETAREWGRPIAMDENVRRRVDAMWKDLGL